MNKNVICRPCKEQNNWEIQEPSGKVSETHYATKQACVAAGRKMAEEYACELVVTDMKKQNNNNMNNSVNGYSKYQ